jgi:hypothetical protein
LVWGRQDWEWRFGENVRGRYAQLVDMLYLGACLFLNGAFWWNRIATTPTITDHHRTIQGLLVYEL